MGEALTSYAADVNLANQDSNTNIENVKFDVYLDVNDRTKKEIEKDINDENLKLYVSVSVHQGGYLKSGQIEFENCNFKLKNNEDVSELKLDSIQSEKGITIELPITAIKDKAFNLGLLNMVSQIKLTGKYVDNKGNEKPVENTTKQVRISWTADNITDENNPIKLNQKVITNKIYNINGTNKRVVQLEVISGIENNQYPIKSTGIELNVPALGELYPDDVVVASYDTIATNGKDSTEFEKIEENLETETQEERKLGVWEYNEDEHKLNIVVNNEAVENKVSWAKNGEDKFIVTYVYDENANLENFVSNINSKISLYDAKNTVLTKTVSECEYSEEMREAITLNLLDTNTIYKSNMRLNQETEFKTRWTVEVGYSGIVKESLAIGNKQENLMDSEENTIEANTYYKATYINKEELLKVLGNEGSLALASENAESEDNIIRIDKNSQTDENGDICIYYGEENKISNLAIMSTKPMSEGKLNITHVKMLNTSTLSEEQINSISKLNTNAGLFVDLTDELTSSVEDFKELDINIQEPKTEVAIGIDKTKLSTTQLNQDVNITATLKLNDLKYKLYNQPIVEIELPRGIQEVEINPSNINILNGNGLTIDKENTKIASTENGNKVIRIPLKGEQTGYGEFLDAQIVMKLNLQTTKLMPSVEEDIIIRCQNEEKIAINSCRVKFVAEQGILLANSISNYNEGQPEILVFNKEEPKTGLLNADSESVTAEGKLVLINNTINNLENITIIGKNTAKVERENATILYTKDTDINVNSNWTEEYSDDVTGYKIVLNSFEIGEIVEIPYDLKIPANMKTDETIELAYTVYNGAEEISSPKIILKAIGQEEKPESGDQENSDAKLEITMTSNPESTKTLLSKENVTYTINVKNLSSVERRVIIDGTMPKGLEVENATISFKGINEETGEVEQITENLQVYTEQYFETINEVLAEDTVIITIKGHVAENVDVQEIRNKVNAIIKLPNETGLEEDEEKCYVGKVEAEVIHKVKPNIPLTDIEIPEEITVKIGEKKNLEIKLLPENAQTDNLEITVDNSEIATVTKDGIVEGISEGSTVISVFTKDRSIEKNCKVNVVEKIEIPDIPDVPDTPDIPDIPDTPDIPDVPDVPEQPKIYKISGSAWLDENRDGKKDESEKLLKEITVKIKDAKTNEYLKQELGEQIVAKTDENGTYAFENLQAGKYIIEFEYNTNTYGLTPVVGKDSIANIVTTEGKTVITTDTLTLESKDITNINIGLVLNPEFDLQLDKYVSKITVQNTAGTTTYNYNKEQLAKVDIKAKQMQGSTVIIEYTLAVTNKGDVPGYAKTIVDYVSPDLKFSSELNTSWYEGSDNNLYCIELANDIINPGETKEVKLILTKTMTANNTGIVNNTAEIYEHFNEYALEDTNSVPANKEQKENDMSVADVIITVSTGSAILYIGIILACMLILGGGIYIINRKVIYGKKLI